MTCGYYNPKKTAAFSPEVPVPPPENSPSSTLVPKDDDPSNDVRYYFRCFYPDGKEVRLQELFWPYVEFDPARPGGPIQDNPAVVLAQEAIDLRAQVEDLVKDPVVRTSPPAKQLLGIPTWFRIEGDPTIPPQTTAPVNGVVAVLEASPPTLEVDPKDGSGKSVTCTAPGRAYVAGAVADTNTCEHTYWHRPPTGTASPTVKIRYEFHWRTVGLPGGEFEGDLDPITRNVTVDLDIAEAQAVGR